MTHQHDHDHDCGHDHDHDDGEGGIEIAFELIDGALEQRNLTDDDIKDALIAAIDERESMAERGESPGEIEEMPLLVRGESYRCGDIFQITITGDIGDEEDEE